VWKVYEGEGGVEMIDELEAKKKICPFMSALYFLWLDGEPYDQMQLAADYIEYLESILGKPDFMIFKGELVIKHIK
jgi:hypothetical protein